MRSFGDGIRAGVRKWFTTDAPTATRSRNSLRSEIAAHIEARVEYLVARGVSPDEARRQAVDRFGGNLDEALTTLEASALAKDRALGWRDRAETLLQDTRFVLRGLTRAPAFTAGVVATLALGLGANSAVFRVADRVLTRAPGGVERAAELRRVTMLTSNGSATPVPSPTLSYPQARAVAESRAFARTALYASPRTPLVGADGLDVTAQYVDADFFSTLGVRPAMGRFFDAAEAAPGSNEAVAVVGFDYWRRALGGGKLDELPALRLSDKPYRIVGVAPRGFGGVDLNPVDVWLPLGVATFGRGSMNGVEIPWYRLAMVRAIRVIGRIAPGMSTDAAAARIGAALAHADNSNTAAPAGARLSSIHDAGDTNGSDGSRGLLTRLIVAAIIILVIASANAANLMLARGLRRRRELAVRLALGGSRSRIVRLLMLESVTLGVLGGAAAALVGYWIGDALRRAVFPDARWSTPALDDRTIVFTMLIALVAGLAAGLAPGLQLTTPDLVSGLKDNRHQPGRRTHRTRALLIVLQTAFSLMLLVASGLLVRSLQRLNAVDLGFDPRGLLTVDVPPPMFGPAGPRIEAPDLAARLARQPGVRLVAVASNAPFGSHASMSITVPGRPEPDIPPSDGPWYSDVSPQYFTALGMHLVRGRLLSADDIAGNEPVVIVNQAMVRYYWADADPLRSCILARGACARVVGVVRDVRDYRSGGAPPPRYYFALAQQDQTRPPETVIVRASSESLPRIVQAVKSTLPATQRSSIQSIESRVDQAMRPWHLAAALFGAVGFVALLLSCVGV